MYEFYYKYIHCIKSIRIRSYSDPYFSAFRLNMERYRVKYKILQSKYNNTAKLLFTDTDSLVYEIETDDVYKDFYKNRSLFDFSDYREDSKFF